MRPVIVLEPIVGVSGNVAAEIGPLLMKHLAAARREQRIVAPDVEETIEKLALLGQGWTNHRAEVAFEVAFLDPGNCTDVQWMMMKDATTILDISRQAVTSHIDSGKLHGEKVGGRWRVCADSVRGRKEGGGTCRH